MQINHQEAGSNGTFYIGENSNRLGEMIYSKSGNTIIIHHTEVSDKLRGKGAGKQLVAAAVDYARSNNLKIIPRCSFAKSLFETVKEFQDVLDR
jgi:uncharacterized protein